MWMDGKTIRDSQLGALPQHHFMYYPDVVSALLVYDTAKLMTRKNVECRVKELMGQCRQQLLSYLWATKHSRTLSQKSAILCHRSKSLTDGPIGVSWQEHDINMPLTIDRHPTNFSAARTCNHPAPLPTVYAQLLSMVLTSPSHSFCNRLLPFSE